MNYMQGGAEILKVGEHDLLPRLLLGFLRLLLCFDDLLHNLGLFDKERTHDSTINNRVKPELLTYER